MQIMYTERTVYITRMLYNANTVIARRSHTRYPRGLHCIQITQHGSRDTMYDRLYETRQDTRLTLGDEVESPAKSQRAARQERDKTFPDRRVAGNDPLTQLNED